MTDIDRINPWKEYIRNIKKTHKSEYENFTPITNLEVHTETQNEINITNKDYFRVDLHGLTSTAAFQKLENVFPKCIQSNIFKLLVITGKGYRTIEADVEEKGVIRSKFERWLQHSKISRFVSEFSIAKTNDGGDGAFYIKLKKHT